MPLSADRNPPLRERGARHVRLPYSVAANTTIHAGAIVALDLDGFLVPAADAAGFTVIGIADESADNATGADGERSCHVVAGRFRLPFSHNPGEDIRQADLGQLAVVADDERVARPGSLTNNRPVGRIEDVDIAAGVAWIDVRQGGAA
jgi:hypothetical protein